MKIRFNSSLNHFQLEDGDKITVLETLTKDGKSYILPENSANRKYAAVSRCEKHRDDDGYELLPLDHSWLTTENRKEREPAKTWVDYLSEKELETYNKLLAKGSERKNAADKEAAEAKKKTSEIEKLKAKMEKAQKEYEALLAKLK